jgi:uncharacterized membrane protein
MDLYDLLVFVHVCGAVVWLGCGVALQLLALKAASGNHTEMKQAVQTSEWFSQKIFGPAGMITIFAGFTLVGIGWSHLNDIWIIATLIAIAGSFILLGVAMKPLIRQLTTSGLSTDTFRWQFQKYLWITQIDLICLLFVLYVMVIKPKQLDASLWSAVAVAVLLIAGLSWKFQNSKKR